MSRWYRAYAGTVTDAKLAEAALIAEVSRSVSIAAWHCLLESAAERNNCGSYDATARRVSVILCEPPSAIEKLLAAFDELGLIGSGAVRAWKKRQFQSDDSKERVRRHRDKKRQETADVTACNGDVTSPYTETETEAEKIGSTKEVDSSAEPTEEPLSAEEVVEAWNDTAGRCGLPPVKKLTRERLQRVNARIRENSLDDFKTALSAIERSPFLRGESASGWRADFDFFCQKSSFTKLVEGSYGH